jgi:hypothetical protein
MLRKALTIIFWFLAAVVAGLFFGQLVYTCTSWEDWVVDLTAFLVWAGVFGFGLAMVNGN